MGFKKKLMGDKVAKAAKTGDIDGLLKIVEEGPLARSTAATKAIMALENPGGLRRLQDHFMSQIRFGQDTAQLEAVGLLQGRPYHGILYAISKDPRYGLGDAVDEFSSSFSLEPWDNVLVDVINDTERSPYTRWAAAIGLARFGERRPDLANSIAELGEALLEAIGNDIRGYLAKSELFNDSIGALGWFHGVPAAEEVLIGAVQGKRFAVWSGDVPSSRVFDALADLGGNDARDALHYWASRSDEAKNALASLETR